LQGRERQSVFPAPRRARRLRFAAFGRVRAFARKLRTFAPDLAIDFQGCFKSGVASALSRAEVRASFEGPFVRERSHLFANYCVPLCSSKPHRVLRAITLAPSVGSIAGEPPADLGLTPEELQHGRAALTRVTNSQDVVALAPFSSSRQAWKRYPFDRWVEIARGLGADGHSVLVVAGPGEQDEARELCRQAGPHVAALDDVPLRDLAAILSSCRLLIGGDTGPMHMAWGVGTPVVALYGPTEPVLNAPYGAGHVSLAPPKRTGRNDVDKFPGITAQRVLDNALALLRTNVRSDERADALVGV